MGARYSRKHGASEMTDRPNPRRVRSCWSIKKDGPKHNHPPPNGEEMGDRVETDQQNRKAHGAPKRGDGPTLRTRPKKKNADDHGNWGHPRRETP